MKTNDFYALQRLFITKTSFFVYKYTVFILQRKKNFPLLLLIRNTI